MTRTFPGANGIALWKDRLFVGDARNGTVTIFDIHIDKTLTQLHQIVGPYQSFASLFDILLTRFQDLGAAADNINIDPVSGDPVVAGKKATTDVMLTFVNTLNSLPYPRGFASLPRKCAILGQRFLGSCRCASIEPCQRL